MARVILEIPDDLVQAIKLPAEEVSLRLRRELALRLYEKGLLSFGKARELACMTRWAFHDLLGEEGISRRYDEADLEEDLQTLKGLA